MKIVGPEAIGIFTIVDGQNAVFDNDALARESNDAFDDVLIGFASDEVGVFEDDNLATLGNVLLILELRPGNGEAIDDKAIACVERLLHTGAKNAKAAKDKRIDD